MGHPDVRYDDIKALDNETIQKIFSALNIAYSKNLLLKKRELAIFSVLLNTGIRKNELLNIRCYDINFERRTLFINGITSKSKRDRTISLNEEVLCYLEDYIAERKKNDKYSTPYLFVSTNSLERLTAHGLKHIVERIKIISKTKFHIHQFRHTFAIDYLTMGGKLEELKQILGHTDIRMTMKYIRYIPLENIRPAMERVGLEKHFLN